MRVPGIIGGLGPATTAVFYKALMELSDAQGGRCRAGALTWSVPINYDYEREAISSGKGEERLLPMLYESIDRLQGGGADFLVMPCNSLHIFHEELSRYAQVPVLSIIEETANALAEAGFSAVGILGSPITLGKGIYQEALRSRGIVVKNPTANEVETLASLIHRLVTGRTRSDDQSTLEKIAKMLLNRGAQVVVLACTDLQLLLPPKLPSIYVDTLKILVLATVREIFRRRPVKRLAGAL